MVRSSSNLGAKEHGAMFGGFQQDNQRARGMRRAGLKKAVAVSGVSMC